MCHGDLPVSFRFYPAFNVGGFSPDRPAVRTGADGPTQPELFGRPDLVTVGTEAADVAVLVRSAMSEWNDMVRHGRFPDNTGGGAIAAEGFGL